MDFGGFGRILVGSGKDFHGSVDFAGFCRFLLDVGRISMVLWILKILVGPGNDFHGSVHFGGFQKTYRFCLDLARISMDRRNLKYF